MTDGEIAFLAAVVLAMTTFAITLAVASYITSR